MLIGSMIVPSEEVPPGGYDEEDHITWLELLKNVMEEENECKFSAEQFCIGNVPTSWKRPNAKCSQSPTDTKSDWSESSQLQYLVTCPQIVRAVLGRQETVHLVTQRAREGLYDQRETARHAHALLHQQGRTSCCHQAAKSWQHFWHAIMKHTITTCRYKFVNSNTKQTRDSPKDKGNCHRDSLISETKLVMEESTEVWRRDEQVHDLRSHNKFKNMLNYNSNWKDCLREHSSIERWKNLELFNQPLDLKLIDFEKKRSTTSTRSTTEQ